jgi:hypothetical protein
MSLSSKYPRSVMSVCLAACIGGIFLQRSDAYVNFVGVVKYGIHWWCGFVGVCISAVICVIAIILTLGKPTLGERFFEWLFDLLDRRQERKRYER